MMNNFNYNSQYGVPYQQQMQFYRIIPIASKADTSKVLADFNGTPVYFHNQNTNEIYIKQFDVKTGMTTLQEFKRTDGEVEETNLYAKEFDEINKSIADLRDCVEKISVEKGGKNAK